MRHQILSLLPERYPWKDRFFYYPETGSTNDLLKTMAKDGAPHGTAILAGRQLNGHGRMGRSFLSPEGMGVYLSILLRPECAPTELMHLTCAAAVACVDALEQSCGIRAGIKWTNDLVFGKRKLGGILTELGLSPRGKADYCIIGIGINCRQWEQDFDPSIRNMAGSLSMAAGKEISAAVTAAALLEALYEMDSALLTEKERLLLRYRENCVTVGQEISLLRADGSVRHGKALDITADGALLVAYPDGSREAVNSGEVSIRGMYGYL